MPTKKSAGKSGQKKAATDAAAQDCEPQSSRAVTVVLTVAAAMSPSFSITGWNPPRTTPEDALQRTLGEVGINDLAEFKELLNSLLPEAARAAVDKAGITSATRLSDLIDSLAAAL